MCAFGVLGEGQSDDNIDYRTPIKVRRIGPSVVHTPEGEYRMLSGLLEIPPL